jgi:D-amino acid aminotransferase
MIFDHAIVNGDLVPTTQARISIFNKAIFSSFGVYEAIKIDRGQGFYLEEHVRRLFQSANLLDLALPVDAATLTDWCRQLIALNPHATCRMFILVFGQVEAGTPPVVAIQAEALPTYPAEIYETGAAAILYQGQRALPACKSLNTLVNYLARRAAVRTGALEGLLHHTGHLTEGSRSNLFAVREGRLITPPAAEVLSGITRDVIVHVMQDTAFPVAEAPLPADMALYDEVFISSTSMHVMPVTRIDGQPVGQGQLGPVTRLAMARFEAHYRQVMGG